MSTVAIHSKGLLFIVLALTCNGVTAKTVVYAAAEGDPYYANLLRHALSYTPSKNYSVFHLHTRQPKLRLFERLANNDNIHVMNGNATLERESRYRAVYFPILRGLKGWRLPIIHKQTPDIFKPVETPEAAKALLTVQYHSWTATKILQNNGYMVVPVSITSRLFEMVHLQRVDYVPRSILDVTNDIERSSELDIMVDPYVMIKYPSAFYFYVNKENKVLAQDIKFGLEQALQDGSFMRLFNQAFADIIKRYNLPERRVFELTNPFIPPTIPIERKELWQDPSYNY